MGRKFGGTPPPFWGGGAGSPSNTKSPRAEAYLHTKWNLDLCSHLAATDVGQKLGARAGLCPFGGGGAGSPSNTMWPGPRHTCMPSFILIRQTVWPQYNTPTLQTDRQLSDSIGRTVLQMVAQKARMWSIAQRDGHSAEYRWRPLFNAAKFG